MMEARDFTLSDAAIARFWSKVNKDGPTQPHMTTPCWVWIGSRHRGYGYLHVDDRHIRAHRMSMFIHFPSCFPTPLCVLHACDHPPCVNPAHLRLGTNSENIVEMHKKGRAPHGGQRSFAKLNEAKVVEIRKLSADGMRICQLCKMFDVSDHTIRRVVSGTQWRHVPMTKEIS